MLRVGVAGLDSLSTNLNGAMSDNLMSSMSHRGTGMNMFLHSGANMDSRSCITMVSKDRCSSMVTTRG